MQRLPFNHTTSGPQAQADEARLPDPTTERPVTCAKCGESDFVDRGVREGVFCTHCNTKLPVEEKARWRLAQERARTPLTREEEEREQAETANTLAAIAAIEAMEAARPAGDTEDPPAVTLAAPSPVLEQAPLEAEDPPRSSTAAPEPTMDAPEQPRAASATGKQPKSASQIHRTLKLLVPAGAVFEVRILNVPHGGTVSGYFRDPAAAARAVARYDGKASAIYVTLNPVNPDAYHRAANALKSYAKHTTTDHEIVRRRWLLLDGDPHRLAGISATDEEHNAALAWCHRVRDALRADGWPEPVIADSGNGGHLLYPIDLPNDEESKRLIQRLLKALAAQFDDPPGTTPRITLDTSVHNAARITKLYGTLVRKGENTSERPHRRSRLLAGPKALRPQPAERVTGEAEKGGEAC